MFKEIGLIGFGNFGRFISNHLQNYFKIFVYDFIKNNKENYNDNIVFSTLEDVVNKDLLILSLPVQYLEDCLIKIKDIIKKDCLVFDVCSVKIKPIDLMLKYLPETTEIIGTHPLFGPQSAKDGIKNLNIVLTDVRSTRFEEVKKFLNEKFELNILVKDKDEHDKTMAVVQGLTHFIAKGLKEIEIFDTPLKTVSYQNLLNFYKILENETDALFHTIQNENPYTRAIREKFVEKLIEIEKKIGE